MILDDMLRYSISNLWSRKLRSSLSVLSILIGIAAIFALVSFGQGINSWVNDFAQEMGTDKVFLLPGGGLNTPPGTSNNPFTGDDLDFVKKVRGVDEATGLMMSYGKAEYKDYRERYPFVLGLSTESDQKNLVEEMFGGIEIMEGRGIKKGDKMKAALGYLHSVEEELWKKPVSVGDSITINGKEIEITGFYEEVGSPADDAQIYVSQETYEAIFEKDTYEYIYMRASSDQKPEELAGRVKEKFRNHRGQKEGQEDFKVQTFEDVLSTFTNIITVINGVLIIIALISIIVAAVNIMNTMYTSILERTREIGIMKAIGSRNRYILIIFMTEAGLLGLIGGLMGIILGYIIANIGGAAASAYGLSLLKPAFPWWLTLGCIMFAFLIGALSGLLPAVQASKLKPVDALRYE